MAMSEQQRRMTENEAVFRQWNEIIASTNNSKDHHVSNESSFLCECSDENCAQTIVLSYSAYNDVHEQRHQFIVIPGHEAMAVEKVIVECSAYNVVQKKFESSENPIGLEKTDLNN